MIGEIFDRWTVIASGEKHPQNGQFWICRCKCGTTREVRQVSLRRGASRSCGCLRAELHRQVHTKHGLSQHREYQIWIDMIHRCTDPSYRNYPDYGGRGIGVCDRWLSVDSFIKDMGPRPSQKHSLDRIDNEQGYSPENCRWATQAEQNRNKRNSKRVTAFGRTQILADWALETGIPRSTVQHRLNRGWSPERALTTEGGEENYVSAADRREILGF